MLGLEKFVENSEFQNSKLAMEQKVSWATIKTFIHELTYYFESIMKLNAVLLEELQSLLSKMDENQTQKGSNQNEIQMEETGDNKSENDVLVLFTKKENDLDFAKDNEIKESDQDDMVIERLSHLETKDEEQLQIDRFKKANQIGIKDKARISNVGVKMNLLCM